MTTWHRMERAEDVRGGECWYLDDRLLRHGDALALHLPDGREVEVVWRVERVPNHRAGPFTATTWPVLYLRDDTDNAPALALRPAAPAEWPDFDLRWLSEPEVELPPW